MQERYEAPAVERAAQEFWDRERVFEAREDAGGEAGKFYCLSMFPYPSGRLHMGHVRNYTIGDVLTRFAKMQGKSVLQPMGWDAFGLPAENAAIKNNVPPAKWTRDNIAYMKAQLKSLGFAFDWTREIATCDPSYYRWNQWLFLRMLEKGIAYRKTGVVNWDPVDQTVLANEQVIDGRGWRTGAIVEKREIPMYYLGITKYADELLGDLEKLPDWPERVKTMQANWIGKSEGCEISFPFAPDTRALMAADGALKVFTTRADTLFGVSFMAIAAEHPIALAAGAKNPALQTFIDECRRGSTMEADIATAEKKGMRTGLHVLHPFTGQMVEVWVANYVLMAYGEGAVMGVPAHDARDFEFALKNKLAVITVIHSKTGAYDKVVEPWIDAYTEYGITVNSGVFDGLDFQAAVDAIAVALEKKGLGRKRTQWRLRDWGISRQRYWGCPVPLIHCAACGVVPVPEKDLPVVLPEDLIPDGSGNPLAKHGAFLNVACPTCGRAARRETDTMDTFVDSAWYYMRYCDPHLESAMVGAGTKYWMPMDQYIGGIEHAILHLLYARFWTKVMRDMKLVAIDEPFTKLLTQGMVLNHVWARTSAQGGVDYFPPDEVTPVGEAEGRPSSGRLADGSAVEYRGMLKMGKTERNGVDPQDLIDRYGADTARLFVMFAAPPEQSLDWNNAGVEGANRFLKRLWKFAARHADTIDCAAGRQPARGGAPALRHEIHSVLRQVSYDYERMQYNTVVSGAMKLLNALETHAGQGSVAPAPLREGFGILLRVLYPVCPHTTWTLWNELGFGADHGPLLDAPWPQIDESALAQDEIELALQINGKLRGTIRVPAKFSKAAIEAAALATPEFARFSEGAPVKR
ncbi:MAG TPA: leucine--tRNA ligase, partial [Steroidobacteraceae bacterium]